jgi:hypothetical protein
VMRSAAGKDLGMKAPRTIEMTRIRERVFMWTTIPEKQRDSNQRELW